MSRAAARQRGSQSARPAPDGRPVPTAPGVAAARPAGWAATAAKYAPVSAAAATMAVLGLWGLARDSAMGNDEVATRWAAQLSLRQLAHLLANVDAVHGLYYLLLHGWMALGTSPAVMRVPSVVSMTAAVAMTVIIGRQLTGSGWAGLFAGLVMALTPSVSFYAQTARSYALVFACVLGATIALLRAMRAEAAGGVSAPVTRRWLCYGALLTLGGYLNELSLLVLAAHAVTVLLARYGRQAVAHWAAASAAGAVLVVPLVATSSREDGAVAWIPRPGLADLRILGHDYFGAATVVAVLLAVCAAAAVAPAGGTRRRRPGGAFTRAGAKSGPEAGPRERPGGRRGDWPGGRRGDWPGRGTSLAGWRYLACLGGGAAARAASCGPAVRVAGGATAVRRSLRLLQRGGSCPAGRRRDVPDRAMAGGPVRAASAGLGTGRGRVPVRAARAARAAAAHPRPGQPVV